MALLRRQRTTRLQWKSTIVVLRTNRASHCTQVTQTCVYIFILRDFIIELVVIIYLKCREGSATHALILVFLVLVKTQG